MKRLRKQRGGGGSSSRPEKSSRPENTLRVIGGKYRGRVLDYHGDPVTRPMKDRVREAVFNLVGPTVKGRTVLDLFAGTGALALEAVSRGAARGVLIERHFPTVRLIEQNVAALGVQRQIQVIAGDCFFWTRSGGALDNLAAAGDAAWLVLISPPYDFFITRWPDMLDLLKRLMRTAPPGSLLVVESDGRFDASLLPAAEAWDVRTYAPAQVAVLELPEPSASGELGNES